MQNESVRSDIGQMQDPRSRQQRRDKGGGGARALGMSLVDHPAFLAFFFLPQNVYVDTHEL